MKMLSESEIKNMLSRLYWDVKVQPDQLLELLKGKIERIGHVDIQNLYYRMLTTFDWYTILRIVPDDKLGDLLSDAVIDKIRFKDLKEKFLYARQIVLQ
ncbi:MAG: hypothetical protein V2J65_37550 [Desulfobacteraceae bacterium]|jgi:hypothetical protein|nr:hypothetical protein [Desulfobacteraceae bacterium]